MKDMGIQGHYLHHVDRIDVVPVTVTLLGTFNIGLGGRSAGPWPRPSAKRLCEVLMLRPDRRISKEVVREVLFPNLPPKASANALRKALSMARQALSPFGDLGPRLLGADREQVFISTETPLAIDVLEHETALRSGLCMEPGGERDAALSKALLQPPSCWLTSRTVTGRLSRDTLSSDFAREPA